jgi:hypothetical protein
MRKEKVHMSLIVKPSNNTAKKGEITESIILARLVQLGYECLILFQERRDMLK